MEENKNEGTSIPMMLETWQDLFGRKPPRTLPSEVDVAQFKPVIGELFVQSIKERIWPMYIFGDSGRGKTMAMQVLCAYAPSQSVRWVNLQTEMRSLMNFRGGRTEEPNFLMQRMGDSEFVFIDDIGIRSDSEPQREAVIEILESRTWRPTVITGNYTPTQLMEQYDSRIGSRVMSGVMIHMTGPDRRLHGRRVIEVK